MTLFRDPQECLRIWSNEVLLGLFTFDLVFCWKAREFNSQDYHAGNGITSAAPNQAGSWRWYTRQCRKQEIFTNLNLLKWKFGASMTKTFWLWVRPCCRLEPHPSLNNALLQPAWWWQWKRRIKRIPPVGPFVSFERKTTPLVHWEFSQAKYQKHRARPWRSSLGRWQSNS